MSNELRWRSTTTGATLYFTVRDTTGRMWNTAGTPNFETLTVANWANYAISLSESPAGGYLFSGTVPTISGNFVAGWYEIDIFQKIGGTAAVSDTLLGTMFGYWDGTAFKQQGADTVQLGGATQDAGNLIPAMEARTLPSASYATPTNITSATGIQLAANQHVIVDSGTVTSVTNAVSTTAGGRVIPAGYLGNMAAGAKFYFLFSTVNHYGAPTTFSGSPAFTVRKDGGVGASTTPGSLALTADLNGITGLNLASCDTSLNTSVFTEGSDFHLVVSAGTVNGLSVVGQTIGEFSIGHRYKDANLTTWLGTAPLALSSQQVQAIVPDSQKVDLNTIKTKTVVCSPSEVRIYQYQGTQAAPLHTDDGGYVGVHIVTDKSGYSLSQTFPANFALLSIDGDGKVIASNAGSIDTGAIALAVWANNTRTITGGTITTVSDKSGYVLETAPPNLAQITEVVAASEARMLAEMQTLWLTTGDGSIYVDHNYGGEDAMVFQTREGVKISSASVSAYRREDWDAGRRDLAFVLAQTKTTLAGRWKYGLMLDPGDYALLFSKLGLVEPVVTYITVS